MSLQEAIELAKMQEQEKEAISLKVAPHIKQKLQSLAEENNVSMNNLISSILSDVLFGTVSNNSYELYQEFKFVSSKINENLDQYDQGIQIGGFPFNHIDIDQNYPYYVSLVDKYNILKSILGVKNENNN